MEIKDITVSVERLEEVRGGLLDTVAVAQSQSKGDVIGAQYIAGPAFSVGSPVEASNSVEDNSVMAQALSIKTDGSIAFDITGNVFASL